MYVCFQTVTKEGHYTLPSRSTATQSTPTIERPPSSSTLPRARAEDKPCMYKYSSYSSLYILSKQFALGVRFCMFGLGLLRYNFQMSAT